jgi:hypothetical protein
MAALVVAVLAVLQRRRTTRIKQPTTTATTTTMADSSKIGELDEVSKKCLEQYKLLTLLKQSPQLIALHTIIRNKNGEKARGFLSHICFSVKLLHIEWFCV